MTKMLTKLYIAVTTRRVLVGVSGLHFIHFEHSVTAVIEGWTHDNVRQRAGADRR